jgi:hypothetical protein
MFFRKQDYCFITQCYLLTYPFSQCLLILSSGCYLDYYSFV